MKKSLTNGATLVCLLSFLAIGCVTTPDCATDAPATVASVNLERYAGLWYQVARYPHFFRRRECPISTARYTLRDDGRIAVRNDCWADEAGGTSRQRVRAVARPIDETNSWLRVRFYRIFPADYLIIELDDQYNWAVITTPDRKTLWVLSRTPSLDEPVFSAIIDRLAERGFDPGKILRTSLQ